MPEERLDLLWLIRQKDDIVIFSSNNDVIQPMVQSLNTNNAYINEWPNRHIDLI